MWIDSVPESPYASRVWWTKVPLVRTVVASFSREGPILLLVLVAAIISRFYQIGAESLWLDEVITYHRSRERIPRLILQSERHHHNPAYFLLMHAWLKLGDSEAMLRAPSAIFGALTVPVGYLFGRIVGGRWVGIATAVVLLLHPSLLSYSQEARMYAMSTFGAAVSMTCLVWLLLHPVVPVHPFLRRWLPAEGENTRWSTLAWLGCSLGWLITLYSHATGVFFILACALVTLVRVVALRVDRVRLVASYTAASFVSLVGYGPWLFRLFRQAESFKGRFWAVFPTPTRLANEVGAALGFGAEPWRWALLIALALAGSYALRRRPLPLAWLWLLALLGPGLVLLASVWQPMYMHRLFLWSAVPFGVLVGAGLVAPALPAVRVTLLGAAVLLGGWRLKTEYYEPYRKEPWRHAISFLQDHAAPGDRIWAGSHSVKEILEYHFGRKTAPMRRFEYGWSSKARATELPEAGPRRALWVLSRKRHQAIDVAGLLAARGWERAEGRNFGKGVDLTRFVPARRAARLRRDALRRDAK
jgi:mannosyltransferase